MTLLPGRPDAVPVWSVMRSREEFGRPDLPLLTVVSAHGVAVRDLAEGRAPSEDLSNYRVVSPGDLVVNKLWARFGAYGVSPCAGIISPAYWVLRVDRSRVHPPYLHHLLRSAPYLAEIGRISRNLPPNGYELSWERFRALPVAAPGLDEQRRIADFLDNEVALLERASALRQRQASLAEEAETAALVQATDAALACGTQPLKRLTRTIEQGNSPQCDNVPAEGDEWGVLKLSAVKRGRFRPQENKRLPADQEPVRQYEVREGDLLMTRANTPTLVGDVAVAHDVPTHLQLSDLVYRLRLRPGVDPDFVAAALLNPSVRGLTASMARGTSQTMVKLRGEDILSLPVPVASHEQQRAIAAQFQRSLQQADAAQQVLQRSLSLLHERRQSLITAVLTGRFDVTGRRVA